MSNVDYDYEKSFLQSLLLQLMNSDWPVFPNYMVDDKQNISPMVKLEDGACRIQHWPPVTLVYSPPHGNNQCQVNLRLRQKHASVLFKWEDVSAFMQNIQKN